MHHQEGLDREVLACFGIDEPAGAWTSRWETIAQRRLNLWTAKSTVAVVGKYTVLKDAATTAGSEALHHGGGVANNVKVEIDWVEMSRAP